MERAKVKTKIIFSNDLEEYKDEQMKELYQDSYFLDFLKKYDLSKEMIRDSLGVFLDYVDDQHYCENCPGIGKCTKKIPCMITTPILEETSIVRKMQMCPKMAERKELERKLLVHDFPQEWLEKSYDSFNIDKSDTRTNIIGTLLSISQDKKTDWVYLYGKSRLGKSYLVALFLIDFLKRHPNQKGAFLDSPKRFKELFDLTFTDKEQFQQVLDAYMNVDVLVLDDFGSGYMSDYIRDTIVYPIINQRLKDRKLTIFISRISLKQLEIYLSLKSISGKLQASQIVDMIRAMIKKETHLDGVSVY